MTLFSMEYPSISKYNIWGKWLCMKLEHWKSQLRECDHFSCSIIMGFKSINVTFVVVSR